MQNFKIFGTKNVLYLFFKLEKARRAEILAEMRNLACLFFLESPPPVENCSFPLAFAKNSGFIRLVIFDH